MKRRNDKCELWKHTEVNKNQTEIINTDKQFGNASMHQEAEKGREGSQNT